MRTPSRKLWKALQQLVGTVACATAAASVLLSAPLRSELVARPRPDWHTLARVASREPQSAHVPRSVSTGTPSGVRAALRGRSACARLPVLPTLCLERGRQAARPFGQTRIDGAPAGGVLDGWASAAIGAATATGALAGASGVSSTLPGPGAGAIRAAHRLTAATAQARAARARAMAVAATASCLASCLTALGFAAKAHNASWCPLSSRCSARTQLHHAQPYASQTSFPSLRGPAQAVKVHNKRLGLPALPMYKAQHSTCVLPPPALVQCVQRIRGLHAGPVCLHGALHHH